MDCLRYHCDPLVHGDEEPSASTQHEQCVWHCYLVGRPRAGQQRSIWAASWLVGPRLATGLIDPYLKLTTLDALVPSTMLRTWRATRKRLRKLYQALSELVASIRIDAENGHVMELAGLDRINILRTRT